MKIPNKLYKYKAFNQVNLEMLLTSSIYCANPLTFNDPLDCSPNIILDDRIENSYALFNLNYIKTVNEIRAVFKGFEFSEKTQKVLDGFCISKAEELTAGNSFDVMFNGYSNIISGSLIRYLNPGVFSLAEEMDSILMWSHYAEQHNGFCFGYSINKLSDDINHLHPVDYNQKDASIDISMLIDMIEGKEKNKVQSEIFSAALLKKTKDWEYEKEWRFIDQIGTKKTSLLKITDLYFGLRFNEKVRTMIMKSLKNDNISFHQMVRKIDEYKLESRQLSLP